MRLAPALAAATVVGLVAACTTSSPAPGPQPSTSTRSALSVSTAPTPTQPASAPPTPTISTTSPPAHATAVPPTSTAAPTTAGTAGSGTRQVVVRPVTAAGVLAPGWSVRADAMTIDCSGGVRSPVSQSADVLYCAPSSASAIACWGAADHAHAYCLLDPRGHTLVRYALAGGTFPSTGRTELEPSPAALNLTGGGACSVRDGGAASRLAAHPDWVPYYFCGSGDDTAVWAPPDSADGGVTRGDGPWTVQVGASAGSSPLTTRQVTVAYFVGTA